MSGALIPVWIIGAPLLGMLLLSLMFRGSTGVSPPPDRAFDRAVGGKAARLPATDGGSARSVAVGAIAPLSGHVPPGAISQLSGPIAPVTIARPSGRTSPGAISRLSRSTAPGAISSLSAPRPTGAIAALSGGWLASNLLGIPLLTRSQRPVEPDETLLTTGR